MAKYLDGSGVTYLWQKIKGAFAAKDHNHNGTYVDAATGTTNGHVVTWGADGHTVVDSGFAIGQSVPASSEAGFISVADQSKLDSIDTSAQVNVIETVQVNGSTLEVNNKLVNVVIPDATVTGVKSGEKIIGLDGTELTSTLGIDIVAGTGDDAGKTFIVLKGKSDEEVARVDASEFVVDGMLESATIYTRSNGTWSPSIPTGGTVPTTDGTYIQFVWNTAASEKTEYLNVTTLIDTYTAGNGLQLSNANEFSVKIDSTPGNVTLEATSAGLKASVDLSGKVDKTTTIAGLDLSTNISDASLRTALNVENGAQVNVIEGVQLNGNDLTLTNKKANVQVAGDGLISVDYANGVVTVSTTATADSSLLPADIDTAIANATE